MPKTTRPLSGLRLTRRVSAFAVVVWLAGFGLGFCSAVNL